MRKIGFAIILLTCWGQIAKAEISSLAREFMAVNNDVVNNNLQIRVIALKSHQLESSKIWQLRMRGMNADTTKELQDPLYPERQEWGIALSKDTRWGGVFSFSNDLIKKQRDEFSQTLTYSQDVGKDLFGRKFRSELQIADLEADHTQLQSESLNQERLLDFYELYLKARTHKTLITKIKSMQAKKKISEWDNLKLANLKREFEDKFLVDIQDLSTLLHRLVDEFEIVVFDEQKQMAASQDLKTDLSEDATVSNKVIVAAQKKIELVGQRLKKDKMDMFPDIQLSGSYSTNGIEDERGKAIRSGRLGENHREYRVALDVRMPLEFEKERLNRAEDAIELIKGQMELTKIRQNLEYTHAALKKRMNLNKESLSMLKKRASLASTRGLDDFWGAETDFVTGLELQEKLLATHAYLHGDLGSFLETKDE